MAFSRLVKRIGASPFAGSVASALISLYIWLVFRTCRWEFIGRENSDALDREPGGFIVPHRDPAPWFERWQVPIATAGQWHYGADDSAADPGVAFPVRHWEPHAVTNRTAAARVHIVVDRDIRIDRDPLPFHIFPPAGMADMIERTTQ